MKKQERNARINERRRQQNRKVLPGFPWKGTFQTKEEVDAYFAGDKIQCLLCGKWYQRISGTHLSYIHGITSDEYHARYGLPWRRGLTAEDLHNTLREISKRRIAEGRLTVFEKNHQGYKARWRPRKPAQPFVSGLNRKNALAAPTRKRATIEEMQQLAARHGGKCLSTTYMNMKTKLLWQCAEGHQWEAVAHNIKRGHWCPLCAGTAQRTIKEMQHIARERGGKCLSESYRNNETKLIWQCAEGHQWEVVPKNVKRGSWCPTCARLKRRK